ncbi:MAG: hypothetical protein GX242_02100 [Clostridiales bacterium]|nr:hypothetical protein [Clostridiales bacterium]
MFDKKVTALIVSIVAAFNLLVYVSMRSLLGFIGYFTNFPPLTYILFVIMAAVVVLSFINLLHKHNKKLLIALFVADILFFILVIGYFIGAFELYMVFFVEMAKMLLVYAAIAIIVYLIFYFPKSKYYTKTVATVICVALVLAVVIGFTDIEKLKINFITTGAAVYAVEDEYQIVWTTSNQALGWVEVDGVKYYDDIAGSVKSTDTVHKVSVPQQALDSAKSYTIYSQTMINEEAYSALKGRTFSKTYAFRPVDTSDGVQYYAVSDTHGINKKGFATASYYGDDTDFVIIAGDTVSFLDSKFDLERIAKLSHGVSKGNIPVIFARGNHEIKGKSAESLYKYIGATDSQDYYFTFRLASVWGVVLDVGDSHPDQWKENFDTANFTPYRNAQLDMLDKIIADKENTYLAEGITHRIAVSHVNTAFAHNTSNFLYDYFIEINQRLNEIGIDVMISGHKHHVFVVPKGEVVGAELSFASQYIGNAEDPDGNAALATGAMFNSIICSRRSDTQSLSKKEKRLGMRHIGAAMHYKIDQAGDGVLEVRFTTHRKRVINTINPFTGQSNGTTIYIY